MKKSTLLASLRRPLPAMMAAAALLLGGMAVSSCRTSSTAAQPGPTSATPAQDHFAAYRNNPGPAMLPKARIYRTSIDVDKYVPVTVNPNDGLLISYPAPSDITGASMPVVLKDGWLLDRRGISPLTRFVRYTYSQYHDLSEAPSPQQLLDALIPDARVTEIVALPESIGRVTPAQADSIIAGGLRGCTVEYEYTR